MDVALHHLDLGGQGKPPLLVLHGMLGSSRNWQTAGRDLAHHHHVLAPDARNHGKSPHHAEMSYPAMVDDVIALLDRLGVARLTLMGHSMGGKTAMLLACRHPERIERLVVVDIAPRDYQWAAHRAEFAAMNELSLDDLGSRQEAELRFENRVDDFAMRKFLATNLERREAGGWRWAINLPVLTAALPAMEKNSLRAGDRFAGPVLVVAGGRSRYVQAADHSAIREHFPAARIKVMAASGHNPHMDARDEFVRVVTQAAPA